MLYGRILLTHDGSQWADTALMHTREMARSSGSQVTVIEVIDTVTDLRLLTLMGAVGPGLRNWPSCTSAGWQRRTSSGWLTSYGLVAS